MISRIIGPLLEVSAGQIVVLANGVGYQVTVPESLLGQLPALGVEIDLCTRQIVRENDISLFGFGLPSDRRMFDLLLTVNGMGPKSAMALLSVCRSSELAYAISNRDSKSLTRAQGVGAKLAERVCLELSEKVREDVLLGKFEESPIRVEDDIVQALVSLGIKKRDAERAAMSAREQSEEKDIQKLIPIALNIAGRNS